MIHNIIIVDDEMMIREGIKSYISSMHDSFAVLNVFEDGREAIEYLKNNEVDIVITDIRMSEVSGLEIAEFISKNKPNTKTVILSGYSEFEYAKEALKYGVEYYISKPTNFKELSGVLNELKTKLENQKLKLEKEIAEREREKEAMVFFRDEFLKEIYFKQINKQSLETKLKYIDEESILRDSSFCIFELLVPNYEKYIVQKWKYGSERLKIAINNYVTQLFCENGLVSLALEQRLQYFYYITYFNRYLDLKEYTEKIRSLLLKMQEEIKEIFKLDIVVSLKDVYKNIEDFIDGKTDEVALYKSDNVDVISKAKVYIGKNITKDISLDEVAEHVYMSSVYFSRYFKQQTGENFVAYLTNLRMNLAMELLKEGKMQVNEISDYIGYGNYSYFSRLFKEKTGHTPKEYARKYGNLEGE